MPHKSRRHWCKFQFSVRTLLVGILALSAILSWYAALTQQARRQKATVEAIRRLGGTVGYDWEWGYVPAGKVPPFAEARPGARPQPSWSRKLLGDDYFDKVGFVGLCGPRKRDDALQHLGELADLERLSLHESRVTDTGLAYLTLLTNLKTLCLSQTEVGNAGLKHLEGLTNLQWLDLSGTRVTDAGLVHLEGLVNLQRLDLSRTQVNGAGLAHLRGLVNLQLLDLSRTEVTDAALEQLREFPSLRQLRLSYTVVSDAGLKHLEGRARPPTLWLWETLVTDTGIIEYLAHTPLSKDGPQVYCHSNRQVTEERLKILPEARPATTTEEICVDCW